MLEVHFLVPTDVQDFLLSKVGVRLRHKDNHHGYFAEMFIDDFYKLIKVLNRGGYRTDINPSNSTYTLTARHISHKVKND